MLLEFSHILAFSALFINSLFDIFSEKGDVPSVFSVVAILGGLILHMAYAWQIGSFTPVKWMLLAGILFSIYGWFAYWAGMWGGADALAMTVLGFGAPYSVNGIGAVYGFSLFTNIFLVSSIYAIIYSLHKAATSQELKSNFAARIKKKKKLFLLEIAGLGLFSFIQSLFNPLILFSAFSALILVYHLVKELEDTEMDRTIKLENVEEGDIISTNQIELGHRERNLIGKVFNSLDNFSGEKLSSSQLKIIEDKLGYSEIVGITEKELKELNDKDIAKVTVKEGLRLVPVFPIALVLTEAGLTVLKYFTFL